ncbi:hypothetical protein [Spirillospora sp. NBC_01491]|uniref:hypothetical protein n=1 Tax=Spirillospora sp. NBC_01491 TaxID=2976007 RepID=UPI002E30CC13|nr:hypothetical protein [Spirillospora sp. NBC_01491]
MRTTFFAVLTAAAAGTAAVAAPAQAATTTWTVTNPNADGAFTSPGGPLTVKNAAGEVLVTCAGLNASGHATGRTNTTGALGTLETSEGTTCAGPGGVKWSVRIDSSHWNAPLTGTAYDAAQGRTSITAGWVQYVLGSLDGKCAFVTQNTKLSYVNGTGTLKATTAQAQLGTLPDGTTSCAGSLTAGETIGFDASFKLTPAIKISATTS